jgi:DNA-binding XRE family transcriptional regulator
MTRAGYRGQRAGALVFGARRPGVPAPRAPHVGMPYTTATHLISQVCIVPPKPKVPDDPAVLGQAVRALRGKAGITQKALADRMGTSEAYVSNIESGRRDARWSTLARLLNALGADLRGLARAVATIEREQHTSK